MTTATGRDAVVLNTPDQIGRYRLAVVKQGIKALLRGMQINRGYTSTACRNFVTKRTGVKYPAGQKGLEKALADIEQLLTN